VVEQAARRLPAPDGQEQRVAGEVGPEVGGHAPADDLARGHVPHRGQVQPAFASRDVADIG
jgi:hypothetical protein